MHRRNQWTLRGAALTLFTLMQCASIAAHAQVALPGGPCLTEAHESWSEVEKWVWTQICIGKIAHLGVHDPRPLDPHNAADDWDDERLLTSKFLEMVLLHDPWASAVPRQGVRIAGAFFNAPIDLSHSRIDVPLWLNESRFTEKVDMGGLVTRGSVTFDGSDFSGELNLISATIGGSLRMADTKAIGNIDMTRISIHGALHMFSTKEQRAEFAGVNLLSAKIDADLNMAGAKLNGELNLNSATIGGSLGLFEKGEFDIVNIEGAEIGGSVSLRGSKFGKAITGQFVQVGSWLSLVGAELFRLDLTGANIDGELQLASEEGVAKWKEDTPLEKDDMRLNLRDASADSILDAPDAWPQDIDLNGFVYRSLRSLALSDPNVDLVSRESTSYEDWLARVEPYAPQPYEQLASVLRLMGHRGKATDVLYAGRERARAQAFEDGHRWSWAGQTMLKYSIGYGLGGRYFYSVGWVILLVLIGTFILRQSGQDKIPGQDGKPPMEIGLSYSLDLLLPIIQLRARHYEVDLQGLVRYYFYFHQMMGYVLASFLIAGLSGLTT